jgi:hypothetical protein
MDPDPDPDPGGPKTCGSGGSGSRSSTLSMAYLYVLLFYFLPQSHLALSIINNFIKLEVKRQKLLIGIADVPAAHASSSGGAFSYPRDNRSYTFYTHVDFS